MAAVLQPGPAMDFSAMFGGFQADALASLFPDPPSQPPPESHGPPILSSSEVSEFNSHIEALTTQYQHTPHWRDPPRKPPFSHRRASTTVLPSYHPMDSPISVDQYHGTLNGLRSEWPLSTAQQPGFGSSSTIAPHQLHDAPAFGHRRINSDTMINAAELIDNIKLNIPEMKHFIDSILSASHPSFSAPFFTDGVPTADQSILLPPTLAAESRPGVGRSLSDDVVYESVQDQSPITYAPDLTFKPTSFEAQGDFGPVEQHFDHGNFREFGLPPEDRPTTTPGGDLLIDDLRNVSPVMLKRKSFSSHSMSDASVKDDNFEISNKRKRLTIDTDVKYGKERKTSPVGSPGRQLTGEKRRGKKGSPRPRLSERQKKENHKASEAKRRERVVIAQNRLWSLLPGVAGKPSQRMRLEQTMDHMRAVKTGNDALRTHLMQMQCAA